MPFGKVAFHISWDVLTEACLPTAAFSLANESFRRPTKGSAAPSTRHAGLLRRKEGDGGKISVTTRGVTYSSSSRVMFANLCASLLG